MGQVDLSKTVVVLDLDDTLYLEKDYQISGMREVCLVVESLYGKQVFPEVYSLYEKGERDWLNAICRLAALDAEVKKSLLWIYRLHTPSISLADETSLAVRTLEKLCLAVVVLTDGRSISQRRKLKALGLSHLPVYISEEYQSEKPDALRFIRVMHDFPAESYFYVGDNPLKDFAAPNSLGWKTIGLKDGGKNIHSQEESGVPPENLPSKWIDALDELQGLLC